jgi:hypothetical protein
MKKKVQVIITKEFEIELTDELYGGMSTEEYLKEFSSAFFQIDSEEDLLKYAAGMYAEFGEGSFEGLGRIGMYYSTYPSVPQIKINEIYADNEVEILKEAV